ncbi:hypothetical protein [Campylobacter sp. RM12651]|uniref:hypothetical protein n=1 Tax=Campylobacter sp. RM12651 TaxID=1660079 RepID=UPI001EFB2DBE|nr:hypothetical protein [Campylobacter sp. RM12651]ULO04595.1 hypothetical protein AVBRAN_a0113 [Campylobacter sp. RM12651]
MVEKIKLLLKENRINYEPEVDRLYINTKDYDSAEEYLLGFIIGDYVYIDLINNNLIFNTDDYKDVEKIRKSFKEIKESKTFSNEFFRIEVPINSCELEKQIEFTKRFL